VEIESKSIDKVEIESKSIDKVEIESNSIDKVVIESKYIDKIRVITKLPNSEQSYKGKFKTHNYINRQNQSTTGKL
jgi:hypothetical protein